MQMHGFMALLPQCICGILKPLWTETELNLWLSTVKKVSPRWLKRQADLESTKK